MNLEDWELYNGIGDNSNIVTAVFLCEDALDGRVRSLYFAVTHHSKNTELKLKVVQPLKEASLDLYLFASFHCPASCVFKRKNTLLLNGHLWLKTLSASKLSYFEFDS